MKSLRHRIYIYSVFIYLAATVTNAVKQVQIDRSQRGGLVSAWERLLAPLSGARWSVTRSLSCYTPLLSFTSGWTTMLRELYSLIRRYSPSRFIRWGCHSPQPVCYGMFGDSPWYLLQPSCVHNKHLCRHFIPLVDMTIWTSMGNVQCNTNENYSLHLSMVFTKLIHIMYYFQATLNYFVWLLQ